MVNKREVAFSLDEVTFQLQEPHDFEWLSERGHVFCVFDQQDSGNICFGVEKDGKRTFVKYAGAKPMDFSGNPEDAVRRLSEAMPLYAALEHPHLINLVNHFPVEQGYAPVFEWFDGECLHSHWSFPPPAKYNHPDSPFYRYKHLPVERRLESLDVILSFLEHVETQGYVAVDFYDGSLLYDFASGVTKICDIDFYRKAPSFNDIGEHFWGAARSKSPEEFTLGAPIDARTNVFTIGAVIFGLLGGETDRIYDKWEAGLPLYEVALRAARHERELRYSNVAELKGAWDRARLMP